MKSFHQLHFDSVDVLARRFTATDYIASRGIATAVYKSG